MKQYLQECARAVAQASVLLLRILPRLPPCVPAAPASVHELGFDAERWQSCCCHCTKTISMKQQANAGWRHTRQRRCCPRSPRPSQFPTCGAATA